MSIDIHCAGCGIYLGIIRDAKLMKNIYYLCKNCEKKRAALDLMDKNKKISNPFKEIFGTDIFGEE